MMSPSSVASPSSLTSYYQSQRQSRDEKKARELNLPFAISEIVDLPIDGFNELVSRHTLTEAQMNLCRDIRRRGKNKVSKKLSFVMHVIDLDRIPVFKRVF